MLDCFVQGEIERISPEAPVPVFRSGRQRTELGGAGNVVRNLAALGVGVDFVSVVGEDPAGEEIRGKLASLAFVDASLVTVPGRSTTLKTRYMAGPQQVLRVDNESDGTLSPAVLEEAIERIRGCLSEVEVVIMSDYSKGLLTPDLLREVVGAARSAGKWVLVDPKGSDFTRYGGASIVTPNLKELREATGLPVGSDEEVVTAAGRILETCSCGAVLVTRSQEGMSLVESSGEATHLKAEAREVFDVSGAGDTVISVLGAGLAAGAPPRDAAQLANAAAGIVVGKVGTAVVRAAELVRALHSQELLGSESKIVDLETAIETAEAWRRKGLKVGLTNGVFDLLHEGHLGLISQARKVCDRLIVAVNGDQSVERLKGKVPAQHEATRSNIMASLSAVALVVVFQEETPIPLLRAVQPDILIKGGNYSPGEVVGADVVEAYGGRIFLAEVQEPGNLEIRRLTGGTF